MADYAFRLRSLSYRGRGRLIRPTALLPKTAKKSATQAHARSTNFRKILDRGPISPLALNLIQGSAQGQADPGLRLPNQPVQSSHRFFLALHRHKKTDRMG
jgi:hypothetical protein